MLRLLVLCYFLRFLCTCALAINEEFTNLKKKKEKNVKNEKENLIDTQVP